jgi:hypothetical protein
MPSRDQLEIIRDSGEIEFFDLDPARGITNIGRHIENDIVIDGPGVAAFHAMLDHRQKPIRLIVLSQEGETNFGGQDLLPNTAQEVHHLDTIEIHGHTLMLLEATGADLPNSVSAPPPVPQPLPERQVTPTTVPQVSQGAPSETLVASATGLPVLEMALPALMPGTPPVDQLPAAAVAPSLQRTVGLTARPLDQTDDVVMAKISEREWTINVEQSATLQVTVINGGPIVAMFQIGVGGLDEEWVTIMPPQVNLYEGQQATVTITINPPRQASSRAGVHHFAVVVSSPNHPGRFTRLGATLTLNPYFEFALGELSPKRQSVSWFRQSGEATLPIANHGNSDALFRLEGTDDERACSFEFRVPGHEVSLATQAEMRLSPEEAATIPLSITPRSRRLIALRKHNHSFTITTTLLEAGQTPRMVLGQLKSAPLIGFWHILLALLMLGIMIVFLFIPGPHPRLYSEEGQRVEATDNELTLLYNGSRFNRWGPSHLLNRINGAALNLTLERKNAGAPDNTYEVVETGLSGPNGQVVDAPQFDTVYRLTVENWLSTLFPRVARTATYDVVVVPVLPRIQVTPEQTAVEVGESVTLGWEVQHATRLEIKTQDGLVLEAFEEPQATGTYQVTPQADTVYIFEAYNQYTNGNPETDNALVEIFTPPPDINFFIAQPNAVIEGTPVLLSWRVSGADRVSIESDDPLDRPIEVGPDGPSINRQPTRTTLYTLKAVRGEATAVARQEVGVTPAPTPTGTPTPPEIAYFRAVPDTLVSGDDNLVTLEWSVTGKVTNVEISGPSLSNPITNLEAEGSIEVPVEETTLFVLAAFNYDQKDSQNTQVQVNEPTPTPTPPPPTETPIPAPSIFFFKVEPSNSADVDKVERIDDDEYEVVVGTDIKLSWETSTDAQSVTLSPINQSFGPGKNELEMFKFSVKTAPSNENPKEYTLVVQGVGGASDESLEIKVVSRSTPQPPSSVGGTTNGDDNELRWSWSGDEDDILGFKLYRSDVPPGNDFSFQQEILDPDARSWTDVGGGCGKVYYIVTLYEGLDLSPQETESSGTSWASDACP